MAFARAPLTCAASCAHERRTRWIRYGRGPLHNGGGGMYLNYSDPIMTNSIIWDNSPQSIYTSSGTPLITYSDIEGGWEGEGNIDADPLFVDAINGDYHLTSTSPCIDAGDPGDVGDLDGSQADMGAWPTGGRIL